MATGWAGKPFGGGSEVRRSLMSPLMILAPDRVTKPLRLSERRDDMARVDGRSDGARRVETSSRPALRD
jgi:hypothetical protein